MFSKTARNLTTTPKGKTSEETSNMFFSLGVRTIFGVSHRRQRWSVRRRGRARSCCMWGRRPHRVVQQSFQQPTFQNFARHTQHNCALQVKRRPCSRGFVWGVEDLTDEDRSPRPRLEPQIASSEQYTIKQIPKFPRRDSKPKKRLRENTVMIHIKDNITHGIALFSWGLFVGLESLPGNSWIKLS